MPNGGPRPDCIHCKYHLGGPLSQEKPYCELHKIDLPVVLYAFCANYADFESNAVDWLDEELDREQLQKDQMYVWLGGDEIPFVAVRLIEISDYCTWTEDQFYDEYRNLIDIYRQSGTV